MDSKNTDKLLYDPNTLALETAKTNQDLIQTNLDNQASEVLKSSVLDSIQSRLTFLEKMLQGNLPILELPTDQARSQVKTFTGDSQTLLLPPKLVESLKVITIQEEVTLFCTFLTAFQILLNRYTGQTEMIIGTPATEANYLKINSLNSYLDILEHILLLPLQLKSQNNFKELLSQAFQITLDAQKRQNIPLSSELSKKLIQDSNNTALFHVLFELRSSSEETLKDHDTNWQTLNLDLTLKIIDQPDGLSCVFGYNSNLFNAATIARMMGHFQVLLESIVAHPDQEVATLPLLTAAEKQQILVTWNSSQVDYPKDKCTHQLFEEQVAKTPNQIALIFEDQQLTYQELNQKANQLANYLRKMGVKSEVLVGICVKRSIETVVSILAILKAGGAYVPLDPSYPINRIAYMLEDAKVSVLITGQSLNLELPQQQTKVIYLEQVTPAISLENDQNLSDGVTPSNLAYVIYTSGSTGKPKGVQIEHRTAVNLLMAMIDQPGVCAQDILLSVTTICFDISVAEIFLPLIVGGQLIVVSHQVASDGKQLAQELERFDATIMQATPVSWKLLLASRWQGKSNLKVLTGGESLSPELARQLLPKCAQLWNFYGPTEATIWASTYQVISLENPISIGRPLNNVKYYILDAHLMPLPIGVPGELYIGGDCLARGYFNRPELTAERFIRDPFSNRPQARMYKTGDLARYLEDGTVNCLGRLDRQVKIRGFRIEIEEIESVILQYPGVQAAVVVVQENTAGYQRLVGYLVNEPNATVAKEELRRFLQQQLPAHMVPLGFVTLDALPLTLNGKVDPKALPPADFLAQAATETFVAPRNELETQIASVWEKVLEVKPIGIIGIKDDFLELGGSSLLAITLVGEIENALQRKIPLNALSNLTTVEQMASCFEQGQPTIEDLHSTPDGINLEDYQALLTIVAGRKGDRQRPNSLMVAVQNQGIKPPLFFCANAYEEIEPLVDYLGTEQPFYLMESGYFTLECNNRQIKALAAHHLEDILAVQPQPPYLLCGYSTGGLIVLEIAQQLQAMGKEVALLTILDTAGSHPVYQNYQQLNYILRTNWDQLTSLKMADKLSYLGERIKVGVKAKFYPERSTSEPYIIQPYQGKAYLFLATETDYRFFFSNKIKFWLCPRAGWHKGIVPQLEIEQVPGDHFNMLQEPHVRIVAEKLQDSLKRLFSNQ